MLIDAAVSTREGNIQYKQKERAISKLKRTQPQVYFGLIQRLVHNFQLVDDAITNDVVKDIRRFQKIDNEITLQTAQSVRRLGQRFRRKRVT